MAKYIDAEELISHIQSTMDMQDLYLPIHFIAAINNVETADVQEVKHGKWVTATTGLAVSNKHYYCSVCHRMTSANAESKYCPNCGAKLKGVTK